MKIKVKKTGSNLSSTGKNIGKAKNFTMNVKLELNQEEFDIFYEAMDDLLSKECRNSCVSYVKKLTSIHDQMIDACHKAGVRIWGVSDELEEDND
jgi:hypothetical protein